MGFTIPPPPPDPLPAELQQEVETSVTGFIGMFGIFQSVATSYVPQYRAEVERLMRVAMEYARKSRP